MIRVWLSGIGISLAAHLAVAAVLFLALDLQPAGQQPETGTRLNISAVGVPHARAVPRPLPTVAASPVPMTREAARVLAMRPVPAPERSPTGRMTEARAPQGVTMAGRPVAGALVASAAPAADRIVAGLPADQRQTAAAPDAPEIAARPVRERRAAALPVSGRRHLAAQAPEVALTARRAEGHRLAARPAAAVPVAAVPLRLSPVDADLPEGRRMPARDPLGRAIPARRSEAEARLAMVAAGVRSDARAPLPAALAPRDPPAHRARTVKPAGRPLSPSPLAPVAVPPVQPTSGAPAGPGWLPQRSARSLPVAVAALPERGLPLRPAQPLRTAVPMRAAAPAAPRHPASLLWSGTATPDPASLAALRALTGATGTDALVARVRIEEVLTDRPCSRVQARLDRGGPRLTLHGHVPDPRAARALMAALRGPLGSDIPVTAELATLPRPLCSHVARIAALGLAPSGPEGALGPVVQSAGVMPEGAPVLRLPDTRGGFVHVDLYEAGGAVVHLRPAPGTLPAPHMPNETLRLDLPPRAGRGAAVLAVLISSRPLYSSPRAGREPADAYLRLLTGRVAALRQADGVSGIWRYAILPAVPEGG